MENVRHKDGNMNIFIELIQDNNFFKSAGAGLLCFITNLFMFDASFVLSTMTYVMSFTGAGMALYNSYLTIQLRKRELKSKKDDDE